MALVNKPDESIFASSAKQGEVDNFPDLLRGWGITFDQTQGIPPMEWFNFLFKRLDEKHAYLMQRGLPEWSATQDYTKGSCVQFDGLSYRALKASKNNQPNEANSQYWVRWGFTLTEIARATLTQYGLTQLYTGYDSQREDLALTPKTAFLLKQLIDSNTRTLGNVIPNSKKSDAVNSNSSDTVATSKAVKTAYDKGVEAKTAADNAQKTADAALPLNNSNSKELTIGDYKFVFQTDGNLVVIRKSTNDVIYAANRWVSKLGDTLTGILRTVGIASKQFGFGDYNQQYTSGAPFMVEEAETDRKNTYFPLVKGRFRKAGKYGTAFSFGYTTKQGEGDGFGKGIIHMAEDNGSNRYWAFEHNGDFIAANDVKTAGGKSLNTAAQLSDFAYQKIGNFEIRRYPDGTMIQTYFIEQYDLKDWVEKSFNWAQAFVGSPLIFEKIQTSYNGNHSCGVNILKKSTNTTCYYFEWEVGTPDQGNVKIQFLAIGRWK
ncbi:tail fiber protein [Aggregatibacter kilianii]|uniref:tail fiber protein n=1 Tax=Aggregatibacter kilianii TaxID=2025884 RepID=UPI000D6579AD|nr:tail fiber protein [Aggregatibacter kilianii]